MVVLINSCGSWYPLDPALCSMSHTGSAPLPGTTVTLNRWVFVPQRAVSQLGPSTDWNFHNCSPPSIVVGPDTSVIVDVVGTPAAGRLDEGGGGTGVDVGGCHPP